MTYSQPPSNIDNVYLTDIQDEWNEAMSTDTRRPRNDVKVNMHEIELPKYNEKLKMLEQLRKDALKDLKNIEYEMGMNDSSMLDSIEIKER